MQRLDPERQARLVEIIEAGPDPEGTWTRTTPILAAHPTLFEDETTTLRVCALAASSRPLARSVTDHPGLIDGLAGGDSVTLRLNAALASIAADDLAGLLDVESATRRFSDAIDGIAQDTLATARSAVSERHPGAKDVPFVVIAMGKWGARELNYSSDIDLIFVHDTGTAGDDSRESALALASKIMATLSAATFDGPGLRVDANLRPEGALGPLSRSLEGYRAYYDRWAEGWELQALLKARPVAGTPELADAFMALADEVIWAEGLDHDELRSMRRIKQQSEEGASPHDIKRSRGGIRDIEFTVQILQLVHGRHDPDIRVAPTLHALHALADGGYIEEDERDRLEDGYRFMRNLEHRIQLWDLRQTHEMPRGADDRARIGRSLGLGPVPEEALARRLAQVRADVRDAHERLYFRPILDALVGSASARLGVDRAQQRLEALGFADLGSASRALSDLTSGINRRARVMHQVLPLMLDWLSLSPDPDLGLAQLRNVLARTKDHSALVTLLQNNPLAGERLCQLLGTGRLLGDLIDRIPEFVPRLADDSLLGQIRDSGAATERLVGLLDSRPDPDARIGTIRRFVRRRKLRIAARDVLAGEEAVQTMESLADSADAAMRGALHIAEGSGDNFAVVAMGKWGGRELSYSSDLDLLYVARADDDRDSAVAIAGELRRILSEPSRHGEAFRLDAGIRPEGRNGPLARSLDSYAIYYERWGEPWEMLALTRARPVAGDDQLGRDFLEMLGSIVWQPTLPAEAVAAIRAVKARVESERIPPTEDPDYHLKLGRGSISDVEFLAQLLQLRYGGIERSLRVTNTVAALDLLNDLGMLTPEEHRALTDSYRFCTRARLRLHLQTGRPTDSLPLDPEDLSRLASSLGYHRASELREQYRQVTRRARRVFETRFYE